MPLSYQLDPESRLARVTYRAVPSFEEWAASVGSILHDPRWRPGFGLLFDRRSIPEPPSTSFVRRFADFCRRNIKQLRGSRIALVVSSPADFGMGRMESQLLSDDGPAHAVFSAEEDALTWLSAPPDEDEN